MSQISLRGFAPCGEAKGQWRSPGAPHSRAAALGADICIRAAQECGVPRRPARHGLAMLMALATVVLVLAGVTAGLTAVHGARQSARSSDVDARLLAGLRQGERLASAWLKASSADLVLPPDGGGLVLVDDRFILADGEGRLSVVAYDGLAGIPACLAQRGSALRLALPSALTELAVPPISPAQAERSSHLLDSLGLPEGVRRFPRASWGEGRIWRAFGSGTPADSSPAPSAEPSLAEAISFRSDGRINLNTAPAPLLRTAYSVLGLGGVDKVLERRQAQQTSEPPAGTQPAANGLRLVAQSDRWQMLITVSWQGISRSWWVDYATASQSASMLHRHAIDN